MYMYVFNSTSGYLLEDTFIVKFSLFFSLDMMKYPVSTSCGHQFCRFVSLSITLNHFLAIGDFLSSADNLFKQVGPRSRPLLATFCLLLITFSNRLDPDQDQQNVSPNLDPNCLTL